MALSDLELIYAIANGEHSAVGDLYDRYAPLLIAVGLQRIHDRGEVEEIVHDVFVEAWRAADQFDPERGSVRAWLVVRMRSRVLDRCRSAGWSRREPLDRPLVAPFEDPAPIADKERVHRALQVLTPEQRQVVDLSYFEGLSSTEIADRISIPVGTVKSRIASAFGRLRAELGRGLL